MTKAEKIAALATAMTQGKRDNGEEFFHFTDNAPEELKTIFFENCEFNDTSFEMFSDALDIVSEMFAEIPDKSEEEQYDFIYSSSDRASVYTATRLGYLNALNEHEISELIGKFGDDSINTACAIWYNQTTNDLALLIREWVNN